MLKTFWEGGQPSRHGNCVHMEKFGDKYLWANEDCLDREGFVCQIPLDTIKQVAGRLHTLRTKTSFSYTIMYLQPSTYSPPPQGNELTGA